MKKEKLIFIDYFRAIAIMFIVLGHTINCGQGDVWRTNKFFFGGGTYAFIFIAGLLFQYLSYKFEYKEYLKKKFFNVIMPYFVTLTIPIMIFAFSNSDTNSMLHNFSPPIKIVLSYMAGYVLSYPLWFIGMIAIFFIFAPVLLKIKEHKKIWYVFLLAALIYSFFTQRPYVIRTEQTEFLPAVWAIYLSYFKSFIYFMFPYILGMEVCTLYEKYQDFFKKYALKFLFVLVPVYLTTYFIYIEHYKKVQYYQTFPKVVSIFIILFFLIKLEEKIKGIEFLDKSLKFVANYSFGIFFVHYYFKNIMDHHTIWTIHGVYRHTNTLEAFLISILMFLVAFFGSILLLYTVKKILNKFGIENTRKYIGV